MKKLVVLAGLLAAVAAYADVDKAALDNEAKKAGYILGQDYGSNLLRQSVEFDLESFLAGFKEGYAGKTNVFSEEEIRDIMTEFSASVRAKAEIKRKELAEKNLKIGQEFLEKNKTKEGVKTTESGLQYEVITAGEGDSPTADHTVTVNYRGTTLDGNEFDSSYKRGQPATFPLKGVIKGWTEGLQLMKPGAKYKFYIPSDLAYGPNGNRGIEPNSTLIFEVELISFKEPTPPKPPAAGKTVTSRPVTSDIIKVPSSEEIKKGAKPEVIKKEDIEKKKESK